MDVKCDRCRRDFPPQEAVVQALVGNRDYRFVCKNCVRDYLIDQGAHETLELMEWDISVDVLREYRERGDTEKADELEQRMHEQGWIPPDAPEPAA